MNPLMQINELNMNKKKIIKRIVSLIFGIVLISCIFIVFSSDTEQRVASINKFLNSNYLFFLVIRFVIYCSVGLILFKYKIAIKAKSEFQKQKYYNSLFIRTGIICVVLICFNEIMLFMRLMG